ncbi:hypothetical protein NOK12_19730 [Nocardioides sp. OK12]|uniref:hypothetical protein n=1 Tax=Nocardioides sp. OK12 TaxID=2758661 RepID=UPI0021C39FB3|nr:hypothetical protein [Nocardioides sp. OK12]GHJ59455.1 hypothetical protein NOK12_19730 [Nocardioides sp. OK12]
MLDVHPHAVATAAGRVDAAASAILDVDAAQTAATVSGADGGASTRFEQGRPR